MLNFVLCDDNVKVLDKLSVMLENIFIKNDLDAKISFKTTNEDDLLTFTMSNIIDVLILDIDLKSKNNGIELANTIREYNKDCYIIFITAHSEYVFLAYKCKTFDYICKPITKQRLQETILRLFNDLENKKQINYIKVSNKNILINSNEIDYIKRDGMKLVFYTKDKSYEMYSSFSKLQNKLPTNFIRCHKSFIANVNNISKLELNSNLIYFNNMSTCDIGPKYKNDLLKGVDLNGNT